MQGDHCAEHVKISTSSYSGWGDWGQIIDDWPVGLIALDGAGRVMAVNRTACTWLGSTAAAMLGRTPADLWRSLSPATDQRGAQVLNWRVLAPDGSVRWLHARATVVRDHPDTPWRVVWALMDLTERIEAEQALRESDRYKTEFLAVLSHELRNPLAPLRNALALLQRETLSARGCQALAIGQRQLAQCIRMVEDLLDTSRLSQGKMVLRVERVLLSRILHTVVENTQPMRADRAQALQVMGLEQPIWLNADPARLQQIFENVLINASKYSDRAGAISIRVATSQEYVSVTVSDNGVGIAPEQLAQVFDWFKQVDAHASRCAGGLGIGLALVKQLVELHGGKVAIESAGLGQGTTVTIQLPHRARGMGQRQAWREC